MKKFLALIIVLLSLSSCGGNTDENTDEEITASGTQVENSASGIQIDNSEIGTEIEDENPEINTNEKEPINNTNEGTAVTPNKQNPPTQTPENNGTVSNAEPGSSADEKILEKEVNDLLDEFIDSLDSYEK